MEIKSALCVMHTGPAERTKTPVLSLSVNTCQPERVHTSVIVYVGQRLNKGGRCVCVCVFVSDVGYILEHWNRASVSLGRVDAASFLSISEGG